MDKNTTKQVIKEGCSYNRKVTSVDVARFAGVSQATVSRTYNGDKSVSEETKNKVFSAAKELGYKPNAIARSLTSSRTNIIGVVMGNTHYSPFYSYILTQFTERLQRINKHALLFTVSRDNSMDRIISQVLQYQVDGIIITAGALSSKTANDCIECGTPVVLFDSYAPHTKSISVCCDNVEAGRAVANFVLDAGHKRIAYIAGETVSYSNSERQKGFTDRLHERGIPECIIGYGDYTYESGSEAVRQILNVKNPPDAIFCANDLMALGAMDTARHELGLRMPQDISIIGFDDIHMSSWPSYSLTTIRPPVEKMINATFEFLEYSLEKGTNESILKLFESSLILRDSARIPIEYVR